MHPGCIHSHTSVLFFLSLTIWSSWTILNIHLVKFMFVLLLSHAHVYLVKFTNTNKKNSVYLTSQFRFETRVSVKFYSDQFLYWKQPEKTYIATVLLWYRSWSRKLTAFCPRVQPYLTMRFDWEAHQCGPARQLG